MEPCESFGFGFGFGFGLEPPRVTLGVDAREVMQVMVDPHARLVDAPGQGQWSRSGSWLGLGSGLGLGLG